MRLSLSVRLRPTLSRRSSKTKVLPSGLVAYSQRAVLRHDQSEMCADAAVGQQHDAVTSLDCRHTTPAFGYRASG